MPIDPYSVSQCVRKSLHGSLWMGVWIVCLCAEISGQSTIATYAGGDTPNNVPALGAALRSISSVAPLISGDIYFSSEGKLFKINSSGTLTIVRNDFLGHVSAETSGTMLIADPVAGIVSRLDPATGQTTKIAGGASGNGTCPILQGQSPVAAILCEPAYAASDASGAVYITSKVDPTRRAAISRVASSMISTIALGDLSFALADQPTFVVDFGALATDTNRNLFFIQIVTNVPGGEYQSRETQSFSASVMKIGPGISSPIVVAGNGPFGFSGDGGPATAAQLNNPTALAVGQDAFLYIADFQNHRIRRVDRATGMITTFAGNPNGLFADHVQPTSTRIFPTAISFLGPDLFVADGDLIRKVNGTTGLVDTIAGNISGPASKIRLEAPVAVAVDSNSNVLIADQDVGGALYLPVGGLTPANRIRKIDRMTRSTSPLAGDFSAIASGDGSTAIQAGTPISSIAANPADSIYIVKGTFPSTLRVIDGAGQMSLVAGLPSAFIDPGGGFVNCGGSAIPPVCPLGDGGPAAAAFLNGAVSAATDSVGNLFLCDGSRIRRVDAISQIISTIAGTDAPGDSGDGGPATQATVECSGVLVDRHQNILVSEPAHHRVRIIDGLTGIIGAYAGNGSDGYAGDGGPALVATLSAPNSIAIDASGNIYISDGGNSTIRRVDSSGLISTLAGSGSPGFAGDGGAATAASLNGPSSIVADGFSNLFVADTGNNRVRVVSLPNQLSLSPLRLYFGFQVVGTPGPPQTFTVLNPGLVVVAIQSIALQGDASTDYAVTDHCSGQTLGNGKSCSVDVLFTPTRSSGRSAWVAINAAGGSTGEVALGGLGSDFDLSATDKTAAVTAGQDATYQLTVEPVAGFKGTVSLSCADLPGKSSCIFNSSSVTLDGTNPASVTLTVKTTAPGAIARSSPPIDTRISLMLSLAILIFWGARMLFANRRRIAVATLLVAGIHELAAVVMLSLYLRRRDQRPRLAQLFALAVLVCLGMTLTACGGGSGGSSGSTGTQAGTYNITLSGSFTSGSNNLTHTTKLTLVVQ